MYGRSCSACSATSGHNHVKTLVAKYNRSLGGTTAEGVYAFEYGLFEDKLGRAAVGLDYADLG
jgi:hypothetical protein